MLSAALSLTLFAAALWILHRELSGIHLNDVLAELTALRPMALGSALALTAASYLVLTGYDAVALHYLGRVLPYSRVALASFVATAVGHNVGVAVLSGGAVRLRMYTAFGLSVPDVAALVAMVQLAAVVGMTFLVAMAFSLVPGDAASLLHLPAVLTRTLGLSVIALLVGYLTVCALRRRPVQLGRWALRLPRPTITAGQIAVATADLACTAGAFYVLLPADAGVSFALFLTVYILAIIAGALSHLPGGIGVFETVLLLGLPEVPKDGLLAAVLVYRVIYYLLPFGIAAIIAAIHELRSYGKHVVRGLELTQDALEEIAPQVMAIAAFLVGVLLLFSGATPASGDRIALLQRWLPLPLLEVSHLTGSLLGLGLTVLAGALYRRVNAAYHLALAVLLGGVIVSLLKGLDWEAALVSGLAALLLWMGRNAFYRKATLGEVRFAPGWTVAVVLALAGSIWLGLFSFKHLEYADDLWWQFAFEADAPRFLRASLVAVVAATVLALMRVLRPASPPPEMPGEAELRRAAAIVARTPTADAALALLGDKRILFAEDDAGFLMFQVRGRSWVALGDPVGPPGVMDSLAWRFRELCDRYGGRPVFTHVDAAHLPLYLDLGLVPLKLGEEAVVDLTNFSLEGSARAELRQARRKLPKAGVQFDIVTAGAPVDALMAELKGVSDEWLAAKRTREKGFSLGRFDPAYIRRFPVALARKDGRILAFANLWPGADRAELSVDLMRHVADAPNGIMDYLFVESMLWGVAQGYRQFNLGMAPLSGLATGPLAPLWHRIGTTVFLLGEHFYNFEGLRAYKEKFHPDWRPKYLVLPPGFSLPTVLLDISALVSGNIRGIAAQR
ncbi:bifunctional lysylphosphatidylglycerol flippase/synthetase MprF [Thioflavicoccus mobilis]|uniref:bifunctional lysylphosphatidylglycerol flippase/synthetase MprF n=1 Tax=Thioflavicoccus mobilis TaxID=80679 RepID=UPI0005A15296|nr:bifunctional lysylphosphatidylglycerol flippase/synthetase MprF [Thioflavicoccus mobilis]